MSFKDDQLFEISELVTKALDNSISSEEFDRLQHLIRTDSKALENYFDIISTFTCLDGGITPVLKNSSKAERDDQVDLVVTKPKSSNILIDSTSSLRGVDLSGLKLDADTDELKDPELTQAMLELLDMERTSPPIDTRQEEPERQLIQNVESNFKLIPGSPSKFTLRTLFALAACLIVVIGYLQFFVPTQVDIPVVAKLADSMDVVWDNRLQMPDEFGYMVQSRYGLKEGYASILFNNGAKITVEAPAELSLNSSGDMELIQGRIYAIVPQKAHGFTVMAGTSKIVDLGTEFGVEIASNNGVQLHVTKGRTMLFAGLLNGTKKQTDVIAGQAKKIYSDGFIKDVPLAENKFARHIDSKTGSVWKEEKEKILFAEYFDMVGHTVKTPLNSSPKWNFHHPVFVNYDGTLVKEAQFKDTFENIYPSLVKKFIPEINKVYAISLDVINPTSGWIGLGFCRESRANYVSYSNTFDQTGIGWMRYGNTMPAIAACTGVDSSSIVNINKQHPDAGLKGPVAVRGGVYKVGPTTLMVKLDTYGDGKFFKVEYYQDGEKIAGPVSIPSKFFHCVGFSYKQTDVESENTDGILLDNFIITERD